MQCNLPDRRRRIEDTQLLKQLLLQPERELFVLLISFAEGAELLLAQLAATGEASVDVGNAVALGRAASGVDCLHLVE